jgi:hypothetical protein
MNRVTTNGVASNPHFEIRNSPEVAMFATATRKPCPFCGKRIQSASFKCMFCGEYLSHVAGWSGGDGSVPVPEVGAPPKSSRLVPEGYSGWAVATGFLGMLALVPYVGLLFGLLAVASAPIAFRRLNRDPHLLGKRRVIVGLILGAIGALYNVFVVAYYVMPNPRGLREW